MKPHHIKPVIGLTLDHEDPGGYSIFPWYAMRENYLVVTGGNFDVDPALFGAAKRHDSVSTKDRRTAFELAITRAAHTADMPALGICGGEQLMNVALGGTLIQHIPDVIPNAIAHEQSNPRNEAGHAVALKQGTMLYKIAGRVEMQVNSAHHQAVDAAAPGLKVNALAPDGVIEGIEDPARRWFVGVQWHPEFAIDAGDVRLFDSFVAACQR